ncbi:MAG: dodecin domain-containing protein [Gammaproteobacteria bacterium]
MSMLKVVEILAQSEKSWEDAAQLAVQEAAKTVATSNRSISRRWRRRSRTIGSPTTGSVKISFAIEGR